MADENKLLQLQRMSDAQARRNAGAYGASTYDVQTGGPSVMDTIGLLGFLSPYGMLAGASKTGEFSNQLSRLAPYGDDAVRTAWAPAESAASGALPPGIAWSKSMPPDVLTRLNGKGHVNNNTIWSDIYQQVPTARDLFFGSNQSRRAFNDEAGAVAPEMQKYMNALLRQRRPD